MRTTVDLPDNLLRRAKATAALRGMKLKDLIAGCIEAELGRAELPGTPTARRARSLLPLIPEAMTGTPMCAMTNEEFAAIELQEDLEKYSRSSGC